MCLILPPVLSQYLQLFLTGGPPTQCRSWLHKDTSTGALGLGCNAHGQGPRQRWLLLGREETIYPPHHQLQVLLLE